MIYTFLSDEAFAVTGTESVMSYENLKSNGLGMLDDQVLNYLNTSTPTNTLNTHKVISDPVGNELLTEHRKNRLSCDLSTGTLTRPVGRMYVHFDGSKVTSGSDDDEFINSITILTTDDATTKFAKLKRRAYLFNIIESCFYCHSSDSSCYTYDELNAQLNINGKDSDFVYYKNNSLKISNTVTSSTYTYYDPNSSTEMVTANKIDFYDYAQFDFYYTTTKSVSIKVWLNSAKFRAQYPYSTIVQCIYPCKASWLLNPSDSGGQMQAVINAASYKDAALDVAVTEYDHSGISIYVSRYTHASVSSNAKVGFVIMFKGCSPTSKQMRQFIKDQLLAEGLGDENDWKAVLPDLFVDAGFYMIPCYYQRVTSLGGSTIEQSIVNYRQLHDKMQLLFANEDKSNLYDYMEFMQAPGHDMYIIGYPVDVDLEEQSLTNILGIHPTYQAIDSVGKAYNYSVTTDTVYSAEKTYYTYNKSETVYIKLIAGQDYTIGATIDKTVYERTVTSIGSWNSMTDATQAFAQMFSNCVAACMDDTSPHISEFTVEDIMTDGVTKRKFYSFVTNSIEYHVLTLAGAHDIFDER